MKKQKPPKYKAPLRYPEYRKWWNSDVGVYIRDYEEKVGEKIVSLRIAFSAIEAGYPDAMMRKFDEAEQAIFIAVQQEKARQNIS